MSAIKSTGAIWQSGEHRLPTLAQAARAEPAWIAAVEVTGLQREIGRWKARTAELECRLAAAESRALSAQLPAHFLCNSLQAVSTLLNRDPRTADAMIVALSDVLRLALRAAQASEVPLSRELALLERYVQVMRFRSGDTLRFRVAAPSETHDALVPPLLLQPLVENAIRHGLGERAGEIVVSAERRADMLRCAVADDGRGLRGSQPVEGIGLASTRGRLRALYGERHRFELRENDPGGAVAVVTLPYRVNVEVNR